MRTHTPDAPTTTTLEIWHGADVAVVVVDPRTDLDTPFYGVCVETGETLRFPTPWSLDITVIA